MTTYTSHDWLSWWAPHLLYRPWPNVISPMPLGSSSLGKGKPKPKKDCFLHGYRYQVWPFFPTLPTFKTNISGSCPFFFLIFFRIPLHYKMLDTIVHTTKNFKNNNNKHKRVESTRPIRTQGQANRPTSPCFKTLLQSPMILSFQHLSCWSLWVMGFLFYQGFL